MGKLSRKDAKVLSLLATTPELQDKLNEYIDAEKAANKLWKEFREAVVNGEEVKTVESTEVKRKFKVGDKVRVNSIAGDVATTRCITGDITEVVSYKHDDPERWVGSLERPVFTKGGYFEESALELVEEKLPNELRAEVIEKAKYFVDNKADYHFGLKLEFVINKDKRVVVSLGKNLSNKVVRKGIAKCHPDDVFNADIGKAIALGRALKEDVSEFENVAQPSVAVGQKIKFDTFTGTEVMQVKNFDHSGNPMLGEWLYTNKYKIIDDTGAIYKKEVE